MVSMLQRGLILVGLLSLLAFAFAGEAPDGPAYHQWIQEQAGKGNPPGANSGHGSANVPGNPADKQFFDPAGGALQLDYRLQMDYSGLMGRLKTLLTDPQWFGSNPDAASFAAMLEGTGAFNAGQYRESMTIDKDLLRYSIAQDFNGLPADSYKGQLLDLPNQPFASANYVNADVLFYLGMHNVPQTALLSFREVAKNPDAFSEGLLGEIFSEATGGGMSGADLAQVLPMMDAMNIEGTINSLLTGEVALAFYGFSNFEQVMQSGPQPEDINASLFLGIRDRAAISNMLTAYGADMGLAAQGEEAGWQLFRFAGDDTVTLALGPDVLLATTNWQAANARMMMRMARLPVPAGQYSVHLNLDQLCNMLAPVAGMAEGELLDMNYLNGEFDEYGWPSIDKLDAGLRYLLDLEAQGGCGSIDLSGYYAADGYRSDFTMKPSVFMYGMYYLGRWGGLAAAQESLRGMHEGGADGLSEYSGAGGDSYSSEYYEEVDVASVDAAPSADGTTTDAIVPGGEDELH